MANIELSSYVTGLSDAGTLDGTEELYLSSDEKTTTAKVAQLTIGKVYKAQVSQTGTSAPVLTELINTLGASPSTSYTGVGDYKITSFPENMNTDYYEISFSAVNVSPGINKVNIDAAAPDDIILKTYNSSGTLTDALIPSTFKQSYVLTVIKYD